MKKVGCLIICLLFTVMTLCACDSTYENSLIKHNFERDYNQVIVTIDSITESGVRADGTEWSYTTEEIKIRKSQLVNYINNYANTYVNSYGMSYNDVIDYFIEQLVLTELVIAEADIRLEKHDIFWTKEDINDIQTSVYSTIDSYLFDICNEILEKSGRDKLVKSEEETESTETTYPVKEEVTEEAERVFFTYGVGAKHDDWYTAGEWYIEDEANDYSLPGNYGDAETKSLAREGVKRLVTTFADMIDTVINVTDSEKETMKSEVRALKDVIEQSGVAQAYKMLGKTLLVKKIVGDTYIMSQKMNILQKFIESSVTVSEDAIVAKYNKMLADQISSYANVSNYDSAATGSDLILYRPNNNYVYVKHILIPFSDEQVEYLKEYKKINTEAEYLAERERLVNNIVAYRHVDGEDDTDNPLTVDMIWSEVKATMARVSANAYDAERTFDDLIFKYNTDPGIFNNEVGYAVKYKLGANESETYMTEFAEAARAFRDEGYKVGEVYDNYILTDYGVHIMYYAADYESGDTLTLNSYKTAGRYTYVKDYIEKQLLTAATSAAFTNWQNERIYYYRNTKKIVNLHEKTYKDLYQEEA